MSENSRIFMHLTSPSTGWIKGECTVDEYENWIELDSWDWKLLRKKDEDAIPEPSLLTVTKLMDKASTAMFAAMLKSEMLQAKLVVDDGSVDLMFELSIELENLTIKKCDIQTSISDKGATVDEDWDFNYEYIKFNHKLAGGGTADARIKRPADASNERPGGKKAEFKKVGLEMLKATKMSESDLKDIWDDLLKAHEEEKKRPDGKPLQHAGTKDEEDET